MKICLILYIIFLSSLLHAQRGAQIPRSDIAAEATRDARIDAENSTSDMLWLGAGCLFNVFAVGAAYLITPSPKAVSLVGKSPEYVFIYSEVYKSTAHDRQLKYAGIGCGIGTIMYAFSIIMNKYVYHRIE